MKKLNSEVKIAEGNKSNCPIWCTDLELWPFRDQLCPFGHFESERNTHKLPFSTFLDIPSKHPRLLMRSWCPLALVAVLSIKWMTSLVQAQGIYCDDPDLCQDDDLDKVDVSAITRRSDDINLETENSRENQQGTEPLLRLSRGDPFLRIGKNDPFLRFGRGDPFLRIGKSDPFLRFGKSHPFARTSKVDPFLRFGRGDPSLRVRKADPFLRFGRGDPFLRIGKADPFLRFGRGDPFLRIGKADPFLRFGRGDPFLRIGKADPFLRFGRSIPAKKDDSTDLEVRTRRYPYVRFGKRDPFLRFGKADPFLRFGRSDPFLRFGKRSETTDALSDSSLSTNSDLTVTNKRRRRSVEKVPAKGTSGKQSSKDPPFLRFGRLSSLDFARKYFNIAPDLRTDEWFSPDHVLFRRGNGRDTFPRFGKKWTNLESKSEGDSKERR